MDRLGLNHQRPEEGKIENFTFSAPATILSLFLWVFFAVIFGFFLFVWLLCFLDF